MQNNRNCFAFFLTLKFYFEYDLEREGIDF